VYILTISGNEHVDRINFCIKFLKKYTKKEIVVITTRVSGKIEHDQVKEVNIDDKYDLHACSRILKTNIPYFLSLPKNNACSYCYLDNDVLALSKDIDLIFNEINPEYGISFAYDGKKTPSDSDEYLMYEITPNTDKHYSFIENAYQKFGVKIPENFRMFNSGVYVFNSNSFSLLESWNKNLLKIISNNENRWVVRDQGVLAVSLWQMKMHDIKPLKKEFNWLNKLDEGEMWIDNKFITPAGETVKFMHFILDTYNNNNWVNWELALKFIS
jgi:hypothetical protein